MPIPPAKVLILAFPLLAGCAHPLFDPERATSPYPAELHQPASIDVQVFRDGEHLELVNSSPRSFESVTLWLNQRYARKVESIPAGDTIRLSLWDFYDERGEVFIGGGLFATESPTPLRLVEIQIDDEQTLVGLVTIRAEDVLPAGSTR